MAPVEEEQGGYSLGLVRVVDGAIRPPIHPLASGGARTVIGSVPAEGFCITDVEADVSSQHLVIWCQQGRWWCQGLGSSNGTVLISGATKELTSVELPSSLRSASDVPKPVELRVGDGLCLGLRTRFFGLEPGELTHGRAHRNHARAGALVVSAAHPGW